MDGYMHPMFWGYDSYYGWVWPALIWVLQLVVGFFVYQDAKQREMNPVLWFVLVIIPMLGWLFLVIYVIIRESGRQGDGEKSAAVILDERYALREISTEEYRKMKEELEK
jgi:putative membrane protein